MFNWLRQRRIKRLKIYLASAAVDLGNLTAGSINKGVLESHIAAAKCELELLESAEEPKVLTDFLEEKAKHRFVRISVTLQDVQSELRIANHLLKEAHGRIYDMLLGDDGQAWDEAESYLERVNKEIHKKLLEKRALLGGKKIGEI